jgi:hypothetical protein
VQILHRFGGGWRHLHRGVSNPPGNPSGSRRAETGGLLTPPFTLEGSDGRRRTLSCVSMQG